MTNNDRLTKEDLCWVLVKLTGFILVMYAAFAIYGAVVMYLSADVPLGNSPAKMVFWTILLPLVLGIRLLVSGRTLHGWLMAVPDGKGETVERPPREKASPESSEEPVKEPRKSTRGLPLAQRRLTEEEYEKFQKWLAEKPDMQKRDEVDQLALFRDAQKAGEA